MTELPHPRTSHMGRGTWLEPEELCHPHGGRHRRAKAVFPDGKLRIVRCGLPDTFFSIPVRRDKLVNAHSGGLGGFLVTEDGVLKFRPHVRRPENDPDEEETTK